MSETTTLTVRLKPAVKADLDLLAHYTERSRSYLGAKAIRSYVERELARIEEAEKKRMSPDRERS